LRQKIFRTLFVAASVASLVGLLNFAPRPPESHAEEAPRPTGGVLSLLPGDSVTEHGLETGGQRLAYTATAGTLPLFDQNGERLASIFYTAYVMKGADRRARPVTFVFNGGPGAASTYLHLGVVGPQVIDFGPARDGANARIKPNPDSWLKFTDLVVIDPVGTGWSRAAKVDKAGDFWSVQADAQSLAKAIALYSARNSRTGSPKYILGESYGGFRAAKVARALQQDQGIVVTGIVMVSPLLDGGLTFGSNRFALGAALQLPSLAAAALDRSNRYTPDALAAAERFAMTDYLVTLAGKPPEGEAARAFYARLAEVSGLPVEVVTRARGFIRDAYVKHMAERGEVVSTYDATLASADPYPESASAEGPDPVLSGYTLALGSTFVGYARDVLGFKTDMTYNQLNRDVSGKWDWGGRGGRTQASATRELRELLALNPKFSLLVVHGRSDIVTPYAASRYVLDHLPPIGAPGRTQLKVYKGGHMFYFDDATRAAFTADAGQFYRGAGL
jgi:carboxypeptidase C (cathepsin A)